MPLKIIPSEFLSVSKIGYSASVPLYCIAIKFVSDYYGVYAAKITELFNPSPFIFIPFGTKIVRLVK